MPIHSSLRALLAVSLALPGLAQEPDRSAKLSGFGTLGLAWNSNRDAEFMRDVSQPAGATRRLDARIDSRLGLQLDAELSRTFRATLQVISKYRYDNTFTPDVSWAFLGWNPEPEYQVRLGRLGVELMMNADSRDVGYSFLWVRPPVEGFGLIPFTRLDGLDATATLPLGSGASLRLKAYYGATTEREPLDGLGALNFRGDRLGGLVAEVAAGSWRGRLAYARFQSRRDFTPPVSDLAAGLEAYAEALGDPRLAQAAAGLRFSGANLQWFMAGLTWEEGPYQTQAMLARLRSDRLAMPSNWAGLLSLGRRMGPVVPYALWSRVAAPRQQVPDLGSLAASGDPDAAALGEAFIAFIAPGAFSQSTLSAGLRWDFLTRMDCKLQLDRIRSGPQNLLWDQIQPGWNGRATVVSATVDFVF